MASKVKIEFNLGLEDLKKLRFILTMESLKQFTGKTIWVSANGIVIRQEKDGIGLIFDKNYQLTPMQPSHPHSS